MSLNVYMSVCLCVCCTDIDTVDRDLNCKGKQRTADFLLLVNTFVSFPITLKAFLEQ